MLRVEFYLHGSACVGLGCEEIGVMESRDAGNEKVREALDIGVELAHRAVVKTPGVLQGILDGEWFTSVMDYKASWE